MFAVASASMADCVSPQRLDAGAIYPHQDELREVSFTIACAVVKYARDHNLGRHITDDKIGDVVRQAMWFPDYVPVVPRQ